ncbi:sentrin-specific protease 5 isoform X1 [Engystomops pustulosus]|uniref:sentrin-specific protease 5 isoform X1 n=2 Tax=Engystomops pustulosus TaxID=76066 RepID=UPI003AFB0C4D
MDTLSHISRTETNGTCSHKALRVISAGKTWVASSLLGQKMRERKFSHSQKKPPSLPAKWLRSVGEFKSIISNRQENLAPKKWKNDNQIDHDIQQIEGSKAKSSKKRKSADETSGKNSGEDAVKKGKFDSCKKCDSSSRVTETPVHATKEKIENSSKNLTSRLLSLNLSVGEDSQILKAQKYKDEAACNLVAVKNWGKRPSPLLQQRCSSGLWLLKSCDLLKIGRVPLFMMQRKLFQIADCGKLQSGKLRARKTSYRLLDFNWMWFRKGFWNCCKKTLRSRIRKVVSYLKLKLQRHIRAGRRSYDMNNNTSGILYEIPQCTTKSCLRGDAAVKLQSVETPYGNAASSQQALLCTPAQWCSTDTLPKKTSGAPVLNNQPDDLCLLLTEKEVCISCQEDATAHGEKDNEQIPLTPYKLQECANDSFGCQENASMDMVENGDGSCPMDLEDSTDSDIYSTKLLDHPYCKSPMQQATGDALDTQDLQNGQRILNGVPEEQVAASICDFLNEVVRKYGSLIPMTEKDVITRLKEVFNQDFSNRITFIGKEMAKYRAKSSKNIGCGFRICYNKHTLYMEDLVTLDEQQWLNDQVINMYGDLIMDAAPDKIHFFNTFFHKQLVTKGYDGVKRWTKKVDLFKKTLLLIPIHLQVHWALVGVNIPNKTISFYDSQGLQIKLCTENILKYLLTEAREKNQPEYLHGWQTTVKKCIPQQKNDFDCGVFMLQYCKCLAQEKPFLFTQEDMPSIRKGIYKELCECRLLD